VDDGESVEAREMTRIHLRWILGSVIAVYGFALALGIFLRRPFDAAPSGYYSAYKDLMPLVIAIPAAYLAFAFQRRGSYLQALRTVWEHMVGGIAGALTYTETESPSREQQLQVLGRLSVVIEEVRGVFKNVPVPGTPDGWYPFEPVKQIYQEIRDLGFGEQATSTARATARDRIYRMWKANRFHLLAEFDRDEPTHHHAQYAREGPTHRVAAALPNPPTRGERASSMSGVAFGRPRMWSAAQRPCSLP